VTEIRWELYPMVVTNEIARSWLQIQGNLQLRPKTIDAYGRSLNDFLAFCARMNVIPEKVSREYIALYVQDLATRPNAKGTKFLSIDSGVGLSNSTMKLRITVVRLFCDFLVEQHIRLDTPVGRGHYVPGKGFGGARDRGLIPYTAQNFLPPQNVLPHPFLF
jgi:integrase/recombinase XerD